MCWFVDIYWVGMAKLRKFTIEPFRFSPFVYKKNEGSLFFVFLNIKSLSNLFASLRYLNSSICFRPMGVGKRSKSLHPREFEKYRRPWYLEILERSRRFKVKRIPFICWYFVKCLFVCFSFQSKKNTVYMLIFCKMSSLLFFFCMILYFFNNFFTWICV